jgi:peptidoglycan/LPS O-acetylase OafA/YrhL
MTMAMPRTVRISLFIYVGLLALGLLQVAMDWGDSSLPLLVFEDTARAAAFAVFMGLTILLAIFAYMRRNWARWLHALITMAGVSLIIFSEIYYFSIAGTSTGGGIFGLAEPLLQALAVALLFTPKANSWFSSYAARAA